MKIPILTLMFFIIALGLYPLGIYDHEKAHQEIFTHYGVNSTIHIGIFYGYAETLNGTACNSDCWLAQSNNDNISYNLDMFYFLIMFGIGFILLFFEVSYERNG